VHTITKEAHILPSETISTHINFDELLKIKIPIFSGKGAANASLILEHIATSGPLLKYDIFKDLNCTRYSTVSRRIDDLRKRGYLAQAGKRLTERGKQIEESMYGLTWRGFVASLSSKKVRENIIHILKKNPLLALPEKESILLVLEEIVTPIEFETISKPILEAYLEAIPNLEMIGDDQLWVWLFAIREFPHFPENFKLTKMPENVLELLDRPPILKVVKERVVPLIRQKTEEMTAIYIFFRALNELGNFIIKLDGTDKPSIRIREYAETQLPRLFSDEQSEPCKNLEADSSQ
jgi:hypothetical protein